MTESSRGLFDVSKLPKRQVHTTLNTVKGNNPYIFVSALDVPVSDGLGERLKERLCKYGIDSVHESSKSGSSGYFVVFPDSGEGQDAASKCYMSCNGTPFWGHSLRMKKFDSGFSFLNVRKESRKGESLRKDDNTRREPKEARDSRPSFHLPQANKPSTSFAELQKAKTSQRSSSLSSARNGSVRNSSTGKRDALSLNRRRLDDDDSRSLSSTSSLKRTAKCHVCHQAEGFSYNPLVACSCRRRFHKACHKPMVTLVQQNSSSWRCYVCTMRSLSRTSQPSSDSFLQPPAKRPKLQLSEHHEGLSAIKKRNSIVSAPIGGSALQATASDRQTSPKEGALTHILEGCTPETEVFIKPERDLTGSDSLLPLLESTPRTEVLEKPKPSSRWKHNENASDSASMDISLDNGGSPDIEVPLSDALQSEDSVSMDISTTCDESSDLEDGELMDGTPLEGPQSIVPTLPELSNAVENMRVECPIVEHQLAMLNGTADPPTQKRKLTLVHVDKETGFPRLLPNIDGLPERAIRSAELTPLELIANIKREDRDLGGHFAAPLPNNTRSIQSTSIDRKDISSATSCSEALNTGSSFRSRTSSQSSPSSPPSEAEHQEHPSSLDKPKGNYAQYITAALEAAPTRFLSSLEICNSIVATYPSYALHFPWSALMNSIGATLNQHPEFIKNPHPETDNWTSSLWSLSKTPKILSEASRRTSLASPSKITLTLNTSKSKIKPEFQTSKEKETSQSSQESGDFIPIASIPYAVTNNFSPAVRIVALAHSKGEVPEWYDLVQIPVMYRDNEDYSVGDIIVVQTEDEDLSVPPLAFIREIRQLEEEEILLAILWLYTELEMIKYSSGKPNGKQWPEGASHMLTNYLEVIPSVRVVKKANTAQPFRCHTKEKIIDVKVRPSKIKNSDDPSVSWTTALDEMIGQRNTGMPSCSFSTSQTIAERAGSLTRNKRTLSNVKQQSPNDKNEQTRGMNPVKSPRNRTSSTVQIPKVTTIPKILKKASPLQRRQRMCNDKPDTVPHSPGSGSIMTEGRTSAGRKRPREEDEDVATQTMRDEPDLVVPTDHGETAQADSRKEDPANAGDAARIEQISHRAYSPKFTDPSREELLKEIQKLKLERQRKLEAELGWTRDSPTYWSMEHKPVYTPPAPNAIHLQSQKKATFGRVLPLYPETDEGASTDVPEEEDMEPILYEGHLAFRAKNPTGSKNISDEVHVVWSEPMDFEWHFLKSVSRP